MVNLSYGALVEAGNVALGEIMTIEIDLEATRDAWRKHKKLGPLLGNICCDLPLVSFPGESWAGD